MEKKNMRVKFQKGIVAFAVIFFLVIGGLTYISTKIDSMLYPTVTVATTNTGYLNDEDLSYTPQGGNTLIPTSSIHNGEVYYVTKNTDGNYIVAKKPIEIIEQNGLYTEIQREETGFLAIIDSDKDLKVGEQVLVKAGVL